LEDIEDDEIYIKWECQGKNSGKDIICKIEKTCPCSKILEYKNKCNIVEKTNFISPLKESYKTKKREGVVQYSKKAEKKNPFLNWLTFIFLILIIIILSVLLVLEKLKNKR
jgi:hypothetical protein